MRMTFTRIFDEAHEVSIRRRDGSRESRRLPSRSFLHHDFARFALESKMPLPSAFWGSVAAGSPLSGTDLAGADMLEAERLAGPLQTLIRENAPLDRDAALLSELEAAGSDPDLANCVYGCVRDLCGRWRATARGDSMEADWPDFASDAWLGDGLDGPVRIADSTSPSSMRDVRHA